VIHRFKYSGETFLAPMIAHEMAENWRNYGSDSVDVIVPVPLHWTKRLVRGYNQSELLAAIIARRLEVPTLEGLNRCRRTRQQAMLDFDQRQHNMKGVFNVRRGSAVAGKNVLLIDDVLTTGATLAAAAGAVKDAGADNIYVLTAARG
jgi:ComF family protein